MRTHLVAVRDRVERLKDDKLAVIDDQIAAELLVHRLLRQLICRLDSFPGRERVVLVIMLVVDPVRTSPN